MTVGEEGHQLGLHLSGVRFLIGPIAERRRGGVPQIHARAVEGREIHQDVGSLGGGEDESRVGNADLAMHQALVAADLPQGGAVDDIPLIVQEQETVGPRVRAVEEPEAIEPGLDGRSRPDHPVDERVRAEELRRPHAAVHLGLVQESRR